MGLVKSYLIGTLCLFLSTPVFADYKSEFRALTQTVFNSNNIKTCQPARIVRIEEDFQRQIKEFARNASGRIELAKILSFEYLKCKRIQEAIWTYSLGGYQGYANEVAKKLRQTLESSDFKVLKLIGTGVSHGSFIQFSNGIEAVLKPMDNGWPGAVENEVFAYEFDRFLDLNLVPMTVFNKHGETKVSVQFKMLQSKNSGIAFYGGHQSIRFAAEVFLFDYILGNTDRHGENSLFTLEKYLVLIDNGRIFGNPHSNPEMAKSNGYIIPQRLLKNLYQLTELDLRENYSSYLDEVKIKSLLERIEMMRRTYPLDDSSPTCEDILRQAA